MNQIEDERIRFYLEHGARIREWARLENEVRNFVDQFYRSLNGDLDAALRGGKITDDDVELFFDETYPDYPGYALRRRDWPQGDQDPDVRLEWNCNQVLFLEGDLICGVRGRGDQYRQPFTAEACPEYLLRGRPWWLAWKKVDSPVGRFWEGDNLSKYRDYLVETLVNTWINLAPLVDEAVSRNDN